MNRMPGNKQVQGNLRSNQSSPGSNSSGINTLGKYKIAKESKTASKKKSNRITTNFKFGGQFLQQRDGGVARTERKELTVEAARGPKLFASTPITTGNSYIETQREKNFSMRPLIVEHRVDDGELDSSI